MTLRIFIAACLLWLSVEATAAGPTKYILTVAPVADAGFKNPEYVFVLAVADSVYGVAVFKKPDALRRHLSRLPSGTRVDWYSTCVGGESQAMSPHLEGIEKTCKEAGVVFTHHPAG
jgi:hypothetical protein